MQDVPQQKYEPLTECFKGSTGPRISLVSFDDSNIHLEHLEPSSLNYLEASVSQTSFRRTQSVMVDILNMPF